MAAGNRIHSASPATSSPSVRRMSLFTVCLLVVMGSTAAAFLTPQDRVFSTPSRRFGVVVASRSSNWMATSTAAVTSRRRSQNHHSSSWLGTATTRFGSTTVEAPTRERTDRKTGRRTGSNDDDDDEANDNGREYPDLEYLIDSAESREMDDPFHILLLGSTFEKPKITVPYVSGSLEYVLNMPITEATELSKFAKDEGMSCLGTWPREECLSLGKQLQVRDIVCRVVPYVEGGQRGWQAKDAQGAAGANNEGFY